MSVPFFALKPELISCYVVRDGHWLQIIFVFLFASTSSLVITLPTISLPQQSQINRTSATAVGLDDLNGQSYFPSFAFLSFVSKYSTYSLMVRLDSLALFLISSWTLSVTVKHLNPFRGKNDQELLSYFTVQWNI